MGTPCHGGIVRKHGCIAFSIAPVLSAQIVAGQHGLDSERLAAMRASTDFIGTWKHSFFQSVVVDQTQDTLTLSGSWIWFGDKWNDGRT